MYDIYLEIHGLDLENKKDLEEHIKSLLEQTGIQGNCKICKMDDY